MHQIAKTTMTEARFVSQNRAVWEQYERMIGLTELYSPNDMGEAYLCLSSDLAFAQSHYPGTEVCDYLNSLTLQYQHILYRRQPQRWRELCHFFIHDVPLSFYRSRHFLYLALFLFVLGQVIGVVSQYMDEGYFEAFFGGWYHDMTMDNIKKGNPMGVYGSEKQVLMFFGIAYNNIMVCLRFFISGLLSPFFVVYKALETGVMDGCFMAFFAQHGYLIDAVVAPNEHGSLELPAAIISLGAGMQLGAGWFFPGKKTRMKALRDSARDSLMMTMAMIPVLAVAAFIESYITRHQEWPLALRMLIVAAGLIFMVMYCIVLPYRLSRKEASQ